jgi:hypothetical protein
LKEKKSATIGYISLPVGMQSKQKDNEKSRREETSYGDLSTSHTCGTITVSLVSFRPDFPSGNAFLLGS